MHFENLGYDFMLGDGTGGLSIFSLKNPEAPCSSAPCPASTLMQPADAHGPADTARASTRVRTPRSTRAASWPSWLATRARSATAVTRTAAPASTSSTSRTRGTRRSSATLGAGRPHGDVHQRLPLPLERRSGQQRLARHRPAAGRRRRAAPGVDRRPGLRHRRARSEPPVHVRQAGRHEAQQQHDRLHALRRRRPGRDRLDLRLRRHPRLLHHRHAHTIRRRASARYATATDPVPYAGGSVPSLESEAQYGTISVEHNSYHGRRRLRTSRRRRSPRAAVARSTRPI